MDDILLREAMTAHKAGRYDEAERLYIQLEEKFPQDPDLLHFRGLLASHKGDQALSIRLITQAIALKPSVSEFYGSLGASYEQAQDKMAAAMAFSEQGLYLQKYNRMVEAKAAFAKSLALDPGNKRTLCNYGIALNETGSFREALGILKKSLKHLTLPNERADVLNSIGLCHFFMGHMRRATRYFAKALRLQPSNIEAPRNLAMVPLITGKLKEGFAAYESRCVGGVHYAVTRHFSQPCWQGELPEHLEGPILVLAEQGLGDTIQFARYVPLLAERGYSVLFEVQPALYTLFSQAWVHIERIRIIARQPDGSLPQDLPFAAFVSVMSLPNRLGTDLATVPGTTPYLTAPPERTKQWDDFFAAEPRLKVGLVWHGLAGLRLNVIRSIQPQVIKPLLARKNIAFYALHLPGEDEPGFAAETLVRLGPHLHDFVETAAIIRHLDLVISVDTAVAHLAGALDCPVWLALPYILDWRWMLKRKDSPWYPRHRLFRQTTPGDWEGVIQDIGRNLDRLIAQRR